MAGRVACTRHAGSMEKSIYHPASDPGTRESEAGAKLCAIHKKHSVPDVFVVENRPTMLDSRHPRSL